MNEFNNVNRQSIFKKPKSTEKMLEHLYNEKNVRFEGNISKEEAKELLLQYDYINVITPYKFFMCEKENVGGIQKPVKIRGKHVYKNEVNFDEYYSRYKSERKVYPLLYESIIDFELKLKGIMSYHILNSEQIVDVESYEKFFDKCKLNSRNYPNRQKKLNDDFDKLKEASGYISNFFNHFDHMSLKNFSNIFHCLETELKKEVFKDLKKWNASLGQLNIAAFEKKLFTLVSIRNAVMHGNSLTILIRYFDTNTNKFRSSNEKKIFDRIIKYMIVDYKINYLNYEAETKETDPDYYEVLLRKREKK